MDNFCIPPQPAWYTHAVCTPNNGLLYIAGNQKSIAYIAPELETNAANNRVFHLQFYIKSILCDPNWDSSKWFITFDEHNIVSVWNLESGKIIRGHKAHQNNIEDRATGGAICITENRQVLSIDKFAFVKYCIVSNTYSVFNEHFISKRNAVSALKASPYNLNMLAVGYRNGLIVLADIKETTILYKLRDHDTEIISLEWMVLTASDANANQLNEKLPIKGPTKNVSKLTRRDPPKTIVDAGDMFDIHSYDYLEEEFGEISKNRSNKIDETATDDRKASLNNENFNFVEACQTLRERIVRDKSSDDEASNNENCDQSAVNMSDIREVVARTGAADGSVVFSDDDEGIVDVNVNVPIKNEETEEDVERASTISTLGSSHDPKEIAEIDNQFKTLNMNQNISGNVYLAAGGREPFVVIWDVSNGTISDKLKLKVHRGKMPIPKPICAVAWYRPNELIVNSPNGKISKWSIISNADGKILKTIEEKEEFVDKTIIGICSNAHHKNGTKYVYTFSMHSQIIGRKFTDKSSAAEIIFNLCTLPIGMQTIRECPHDPNRIAIAGNNKRINILDLTTLKPSNIQIQSLVSKVQAKVLALAWHPVNESLISFSTDEGRIGIFDINKVSSQPEIKKRVCDKDVYSISYGISSETSKCVLYAPHGPQLLIFHERNSKNVDDSSLQFPSKISSVSANDKYLAVGLADGHLKILTTPEQKEIYSAHLSQKYISELSWSTVNRGKLAVASSSQHIYIIEATSDSNDSIKSFEKTSEFIAHKNVIWVKWSNQSEHKLVSTGGDHTVRVWNTLTKECIAWSEYDNRMFCAIFMPSDENFILCSGQWETLHCFDIRTHSVDKIGEFDGKPKKKSNNGDVEWATVLQQDVQKRTAQEKKKLKKLEKLEVQEGKNLIEMDANHLTSTVKAAPAQMSFTTIFYLSNKELNKESLSCLERLLKENDPVASDESDPKEILHSKLFSTRENVQELLERELKNHKTSKTESIGNLIIPQLNYNLKENIVESITTKQLTEQHIALAPSISYEFWKICCKAYANQCIEQGLVLQAMPYLLSIHHITDTIEKLCDSHFYREAWIVAKMYKEPEEKNTFDAIVTKWIAYVTHVGNFEGAALIAFLSGQPQTAIDIIEKRERTPQIENIIQLLQEKIEKK